MEKKNELQKYKNYKDYKNNNETTFTWALEFYIEQSSSLF